MNGIFITFEGPDASGKTTQIRILCEYLQNMGIDYVVTREPGGTPIGEKIRSIILDKENSEMLPVTEALLYAASRAQHVGEIILPALKKGRVVISDRFTDSSIAYQGFGRNLGDIVSTINAPATQGLKPDVTFLLRTDPAKMRNRRKAAEEDRMDSQKLEFHETVLRGYFALSEKEPERIRIIDGERPIEQIAREIRYYVDNLLKNR